ncbi:MAG: PAS domain-containing protein [Acidobacteria bacterium]|nr:PAS domain-containing protein [Acidobacteriota bacterium]
MALVFFSALAAFALALIFARTLRRKISGENSLSCGFDPELPDYPLSAVIQELKQQKFALQNEQQLQKRRSKMSESIASTVIANLPCGVLFLAPSGLVRQANPAARQMLGFASPLGMRVEELFAKARHASEATADGVLDAFRHALDGQARAADLRICCLTPSGEARQLSVGVIPLREPNGKAVGAAVLVTDETRHAERRQAEAANAERGVELALELRTSVSTIRACVERMAASDDRQQRGISPKTFRSKPSDWKKLWVDF